MIDYKAIGQKIKALRKANNLSQEQLAEKVWISTTHMSHIETGGTKLSLPVLVDLANALGVGTDDILCSSIHEEKGKASDSIQQILRSCTPQQAKAIEDVVKAVKQAMDTHI